METEQVGTRGLVCSSEGLKILPNVHEGLLKVYRIPLGSIFVKHIVVMVTLSCLLKVHPVDDQLVNEV